MPAEREGLVDGEPEPPGFDQLAHFGEGVESGTVGVAVAEVHAVRQTPLSQARRRLRGDV
jgi:hypothetical protein